MENYNVSEVLVQTPWEENLWPRPRGEYVEVLDVDPVSQAMNEPVDLNEPHLLAKPKILVKRGRRRTPEPAFTMNNNAVNTRRLSFGSRPPSGEGT